jgi:hypothetical protein
MSDNSGMARLYIRDFPEAENVDRMSASIDLQVRHRISGVDASLLVCRTIDQPNQMIELWRYHNQDDQAWVHQSLTSAQVIPDAMTPKNKIFNLDLIYQSDTPDF